MMEDRWASMRSHPRSTASLRLRLEWDEGEARRTANGLTVDVSHSGCMAVIGADVPLAGKFGLCCPRQVAVRKAKSSGVDTKLGKSASLSPNPTPDFGRQDLIRFSNDTRPAAHTPCVCIYILRSISLLKPTNLNHLPTGATAALIRQISYLS